MSIRGNEKGLITMSSDAAVHELVFALQKEHTHIVDTAKYCDRFTRELY